MLVFVSLTEGSEEAKAQFLRTVIRTISCDTQSSMAENVLDGVAEFYSIMSKDKSRTGITARKLILQAVAGSKVRDSGQTGLVSDTLGARKRFFDTEVKKRMELEEHQKLRPIMDMLRRTSPHGGKYVTEATEMEVVGFYESDEQSEIMKGHNNIFKEVIVSDTGVKTYFQRSKRVLKIPFCDLLKAAQNQIGFHHCLRTLMNLRPPWVHLAREAHKSHTLMSL